MQQSITAQQSSDKVRLRVADLAKSRDLAFTLQPDAQWREAIASMIGIPAVRKLRFAGRLRPLGKADWQLEADLGATVVQPCIVTLEDVASRIDEEVERVFLAEMPELPDAAEVEMPEDDTVEALGDVIDLEQVMIEALALALPLYPRTKDAALETAAFTEPGGTPMTDEDARPFAGLKALRDKLADKD
ncbi:MAG: DUF177 domain-containing protein [Rhodobacteraceae bacterium]|nr:DUF177 domain-containing protein [Alphaproteobacteria bacterium]MBT8476076.1 DUF177 domain-containing protein [Alphaproteobacteria bacterium]NNK67684.1 DUF177 domain-containing protein [Paracoccaceae bacterium]